jgi:hypothetical protein
MGESATRSGPLGEEVSSAGGRERLAAVRLPEQFGTRPGRAVEAGVAAGEGWEYTISRDPVNRESTTINER